jgi:hypothetical protein
LRKRSAICSCVCPTAQLTASLSIKTSTLRVWPQAIAGSRKMWTGHCCAWITHNFSRFATGLFLNPNFVRWRSPVEAVSASYTHLSRGKPGIRVCQAHNHEVADSIGKQILVPDHFLDFKSYEAGAGAPKEEYLHHIFSGCSFLNSSNLPIGRSLSQQT